MFDGVLGNIDDIKSIFFDIDEHNFIIFQHAEGLNFLFNLSLPKNLTHTIEMNEIVLSMCWPSFLVFNDDESIVEGR